jgi:molecular chaperone GrpE
MEIHLNEDVKQHTKRKKINLIDKNKEIMGKNTEIDLLKEQNSELENNVAELQQKIEELTASNAEIEDLLKRRVAEFDNFKKRTDKEKMDLLEYGASKLLTKFVDLLDDLNNATESAQNTTDIESVITGLNMIAQKAEKLFAEEGVVQMEINIGDEFNVDFHEALMRQPSDLPEGQITMVLQKGYLYKDKVIRYAKVATSAGNDA